MYAKAFSAACRSSFVGHQFGIRHGRVQGHPLAGVGSPRDERAQRGRVEIDLGVEDGAGVGAQLLPVLHRGIPLRAGRGVRAAAQKFVSGLVRRHHARPGAGFDAHVADRHPAFHGQRFDGTAPVFDDMTLPTAGTDLRDQRKDDVLGGHAGGQRPVDIDRHRLEGPQRQGLGGQHVLDLRGANPHGQRAKCAVRGRVTVATDDRHSRLGEAQLRTDDMHDALLDVTHRIEPDAEFLAVAPQRLDLRARHRVGDRLVDVDGGDVVVLGGQRQARGAAPAGRPGGDSSKACGLVTSCTKCRSM